MKYITRWYQIFLEYTKPDTIPIKWQRIILFIILGIVLIIRLSTINIPALDRTTWKEIDYLMISKNYWLNGFNFLEPEVSWPAEPPRVTEMELPIVPFTAALLYDLFGFNVYSARAITLLAFLLLIIYIFKLTKRELGPILGISAAFAAGILPLYHHFGRYLFTEPLMIAMSVVTLYYVAEWVDYERRRDWILSIITLTLTIALKIEALYLLLPIIWLGYRKYKLHYATYKHLIGIILIAMILPVIWYSYAYYLESTGAHLFGIFMGHNKSQTLTMLVNPEWYRTMFSRIIFILGGWIGVILVIPGFIIGLFEKRARLFVFYFLAIIAYFIIVAEGNIDAPYRQMTIIPSLSVFISLGALAIVVTIVLIIQRIRTQITMKKWGSIFVLLFCLALITLIPARRYNEIRMWGDDEIIMHMDRWQAAQELLKFTDPQSKLITAGEYSVHVGGNDLSPVLYYYSGLQGWSLQSEDWDIKLVESLINKGATHFIAIRVYNNPDPDTLLGDESGNQFIMTMKNNYKVISEHENFIIIDLQ
jgi:4-amino-4-deoxy-L-arabinose transferase-like glycosyltransferase